MAAADDDDRKYVLTGEKLELNLTEKFLGDYLFNGLKKQSADDLFQVIADCQERMTVRELLESGAEMCRGLTKRGLKRGDVVTLFLSNRSYAYSAFLAVTWAGGVPNPLDCDSKTYEMDIFVKQIRPSWIFCEEQKVAVVMESLANVKHSARVVLFGESASDREGVARIEDIAEKVDMNEFRPVPGKDAHDLALILPSSGSTGMSKGVGLTHENLLRSMPLWAYIRKLCTTKPQLVTSPLFWVTGATCFMARCAFAAFRVVYITNDPDSILKTIQDYKLYSAILVPAVIRKILDSGRLREYDLSSFKDVYTGGSILGRPTVDAFKREWPEANLLSLYGMTEAGFVAIPPDASDDPICGTPAFNMEVKIVDVDTGKLLGPNETGEIVIRSPTVFKEYVGNEEATKGSRDSEGWYRSGDIGHYTPDKLLYVDGRIKEIIKFENKVISPVEVEMYISTLPGVEDVGVAGVLVGEDSHHLMALVSKSPNSTLTPDDVKKRVADNLSSVKHLKAGVYFVDKFPRSVSGKIQRKILNEMAKRFYEESNRSQS